MDKHWNILSVIIGSRLYGIHQSASDIDVRGVFLAPRRVRENLFEQKDTIKGEDWLKRDSMELVEYLQPSGVRPTDADVICYSLSNFFVTAARGPLNALEVLWAPEEYCSSLKEAGRVIRGRRSIFATAKSKAKFLGVFKSYVGRALNPPNGIRNCPLGYDTKAAAHAVRVFRTGLEYLRTGICTPSRIGIDADELCSIRKGEWNIKTFADKIELMGNALANFDMAQSPLPADVNKDLIQDFYEEIIDSYGRP